MINERVRKQEEAFDNCLIPVELERIREYALATFDYYGSDHFECLQLIFPDTAGLFPNEEEYDYDQEVLGDFSVVRMT